MATSRGFDGRLYRLTTGTRATWGTADTNGLHAGAAPANLTEITSAKDITVNEEDSELDATTRGGRGYKITVGGLRDVSVDIPILYDPADPHFLALEKARLNRTTVALAFLDGDKATAGVVGTWADFSVLKKVKGEELDGLQMVTFTVKPGPSAVPVETVVVGGA
jgi:hypothetical protein